MPMAKQVSDDACPAAISSGVHLDQRWQDQVQFFRQQSELNL
jgi:hypothetical protein